MKIVSELNTDEKRKLLNCIHRGIIAADEVEESTLVIENASDWFTAILSSITARRENTPMQRMIIIDDTIRDYIRSSEEIILKNVKDKRSNILEGVRPFNVLDLGPGEPSKD